MKKSLIPLYLSGALIAALVLPYFFWPAYHDFVHEMIDVLGSDDKQRTREWVSGFGFWGPLIVIVGMILQMILIFLPSWGLMIVAVLAYGPVWGAALSVLAVAVASSLGYLIGRMVSEAALERLIGKKTREKVEAYVEEYGFWAVIATRIAPFLSNDAISFVGGMLQMGYVKFILATIAGITPLAAAIGYFGQDTDTLKTGLIWISAIALAAVVGKVAWDHFHGGGVKERLKARG